MILRPEQIRLLRLGCPAIPANGGDSESDASTTSNTTNHNFVTTEDRRVVASDAAVAVSGNGNVTSRTENTSFTDASDRSTSLVDNSDRSTAFTDNSDRSTAFTDNSDKSTAFSDSSIKDAYNSTSFADHSDRSVNYSSTDFGSVSKALEGVTNMGIAAVDLGDTSVTGAISAMKDISQNNLTAVMAAFDAAKVAGQNSIQVAGRAMEFAANNTALTQQSFAESAFGPDADKTTILAVIALVGALGVAIVMKK